MLRNIVAVIAGAMVTLAMNPYVEIVREAVWPLSEYADLTDSASAEAIMTKLPVTALIFFAASHAVGTFVGAAVTAAIARCRRIMLALTLGVIGMAAGLARLLLLPSPAWFWALDLAIYLPAAFAGARFVSANADSIQKTDESTVSVQATAGRRSPLLRMIAIVGGASTGVVLGNILGVILGCFVLSPGSNLCGLVGMMYGAPSGLVIGGALVWYFTRPKPRSGGDYGG